MKNYADLGGCYPPQPPASVGDTLLVLHNSSYHTQPHPIIVYYHFDVGGDNMASILFKALSKIPHNSSIFNVLRCLVVLGPSRYLPTHDESINLIPEVDESNSALDESKGSDASLDSTRRTRRGQV